jgi:hypothetical protein
MEVCRGNSRHLWFGSGADELLCRRAGKDRWFELWGV